MTLPCVIIKLGCDWIVSIVHLAAMMLGCYAGGFRCGLLLYWFTSGLIGTLEAEYIRKRRDRLKAEAAAPQLIVPKK